MILKKIGYMKIKYPFLLIFFVLILACANSSKEEKKIRNIVEKFCNLDFEGSRLSSKTWSKIRPFIAYEEEPGWDAVIGIRSYNIHSILIDDRKANVTVKYDIIRAYPTNFESLELKKYETTIINLINKQGEWLIKDYVPYPRVSDAKLSKESIQ